MGKYTCSLCPHKCQLSLGERGRCLVRSATNDGVVLSDYGKITNIAVEPIEKKPIFHFKPGLKVLSAGSFGCSFFCDYCQNFLVSQRNRLSDSKTYLPIDLINLAKERNCGGLCLTYNEPTVSFEYLIDLAKECKQHNLDSIIKTNAFLEPDPWTDVCNNIDAMNIDWKGTGERLSKMADIPIGSEYIILRNLNIAIMSNTHVEISIPIYHDTVMEDFEREIKMLAIDPDVPIHLLKIFPANRINLSPSTDDDIVRQCWIIAKKYFTHVYVQNIYNISQYRTTTCDKCNRDIMYRDSYKTKILLQKDDKCSDKCLLSNIAW